MKITEPSHLSIYKIDPGTGQKAPASKGPDNLPFAPGQLIKGTVAGFTVDGKVLLDVGGQTVTARTLVPLTLGSELWLETGKGDSFPLLTLAAKKGAVQDFLKLFISGTPSPAAGTKGLADLLSALLPGLAAKATAGGQLLAGSMIAATNGGEAFPEVIKMLTMLLGSSSGPQKEITQLLDALGQNKTMLQPGLEDGMEKLAKILAGTQKEITQLLDSLGQNKTMLQPGLEDGMEKLVKILAGTQKEITQLLDSLGQNKTMLQPGLEDGMEKLVKILAGTQKEITQLLDSLEHKAAVPKPVLEPGAEKLVKILAGTQKEITQLLDSLEHKAAVLKSVLEPGAEKLVKILAAHQQLNSQPPQTTDQNFLLFPCFFAGNAGWGEWIFSMEKETDPPGGEHYSLSFFLEMSRLGPLALQATIADRTITGQFLLASEKARAHIADNTQELVQILENQGYRPVSFSCRVNRENIVSQLKEALEEKAAIRRFSLLDVSV